MVTAVGGELVQEYTAGVGIKIVNNKISLTGTSKDNYRYVRNPIDGTLHMSNGCGWDLVNTDNKEVTGIYCNGSNEVIISEKDYTTILRGSSIQLGNSNTIVNIPYLPNYTSASKYLVDDGNGNIGWKTISSSGGSSLPCGLTIKLDGTNQITSWKGSSDASINITASSIGAATTSWVKGAFGDTLSISGNTLYLKNYNGSQLSSVTLPTSSGGGNYAPLNHTHDHLTGSFDVTVGSSTMYPDGDGSYSCGSSGHRWKYVYASNGINTGSDEYIKENIKSITNFPSIDKFYMSLNPIQYKFKQRPNDDEISKIHFGFGARETERHLKENNFESENYSIVTKSILDKPNFVGRTDEYSMNYLEFISLNTHMTQKAHHRIDSLTQENQKLKNTILSLKGEIAIIKQKLEELA